MRGVVNSRNSSVVQTISNDLAMNNDKSRLMSYAYYSDNGSQILEKQMILDDIQKLDLSSDEAGQILSQLGEITKSAPHPNAMGGSGRMLDWL